MDLFKKLMCVRLFCLLSYLLSELLCLSFCDCDLCLYESHYLLIGRGGSDNRKSEQTDNKYFSFMFWILYCYTSLTSLLMSPICAIC